MPGPGAEKREEAQERGPGALDTKKDQAVEAEEQLCGGEPAGGGGVPETTWERLQGQVVTSCRKGLRTRAENWPLSLAPKPWNNHASRLPTGGIFLSGKDWSGL